jgi:hypothetical protein
MRRTIVRATSVAGLGSAAGLGLATALLLAPGAALADATVSATTTPPGGPTTIAVGCGADATSASVSGTSWGGPSQIPLETYPAGGPGAFRSTVSVPASVTPGSYEVSATCSDGEGGIGTLVVSPAGAPQGGGGSTSEGPNAALLAGGAAVAVLAGAGAVALRRRQRA